jgi:hypothetical protein
LKIFLYVIYSNFFSEQKKETERKKYFLNMLYAWGLALIFTIICHACDSIDAIPYELQPGMGTDTAFLKGIPKNTSNISLI